MKTVQLKIASRQLDGAGARRLIVCDVVDTFGIAWCDLVPNRGIIFAEGLEVDDRIAPRARYAALQLAIQSVIVTSAVMGMRVACAPRSHFLRRMLIRAGWMTMDDPALLVREPGAAFTRPLPSGYRPAPLKIRTSTAAPLPPAAEVAEALGKKKGKVHEKSTPNRSPPAKRRK